MDRRSFVKVTAATSASATLGACGNPEEQFIRFISDELLPPGIAVTRNSICPLCAAGCGVEVRVMEGDVSIIRNGVSGVVSTGLAKKLEGRANHPVNQGRLCPRGQASIQLTYHPDRIRGPLRRTGERGSAEFQSIGWDEALQEVTDRLNGLLAAGRGPTLRFLTGPLKDQRAFLIGEFLERFGSGPAIRFETLGDGVLREANRRSFGRAQLPTLDLAESRYVISFGADALGTWNSPVGQSVAYGTMRQGRGSIRGKWVQVEYRMSLTGANADQWVPARPGTEGVLALGIAHAIMERGLRAAEDAGGAGRLIQGWAEGLPDFTADEVERITGVGAEVIAQLGREFHENSPAMAVIAGGALAQTNGLFNALAVNALNALTGNVGVAGGIRFTPQPELLNSGVSDNPTIQALAREILDAADGVAPVDTLLIHEADPVFGTPPAWQVRQALERIPFIVSFGSFLDDTSSMADLVLPDHSFLESFVDHVPEAGASIGMASAARPAMRPLHDTRSMPDVLLELGRGLNLARPLEWETYEDVLQARFEALPPPEGFNSSWIAAQAGGTWIDPTGARAAISTATDATSLGYSEPIFDGDAAEYPFHFLPYPSQAFLDGSLAHLPWLQELPDPMTTAMWSSWVEINPRTAGELGIAEGNLVEVRSAHGTVRAPALLFPGIAPDVVAMPIGQGHETFTRYASGRGANPIKILAPSSESETDEWAWAATRVQLRRMEGAGDLILFAGSLREHEDGPR